MAKSKETERECVEMKKQEEDIGYRKNKKGMGSYDAKKEADAITYPGKH